MGIKGDSKEITLKKSRIKNLVAAISLTFLFLFFGIIYFHSTDKVFGQNLYATIIFNLLFVAPILYFSYNYFDGNPKLIIRETGIWHHKRGNIPWEEIWYVHLDYRIDEGSEYLHKVYLKLTEGERIIEVPVNFMNLESHEVIEAFQKYKPDIEILNF